MKVIGAAYGRTGTSSLKLALERLGFGKCYHFTEMLRAGHVRQWRSIARGEPPDWDRLFAGFGSATDWPAAAYYRELAAFYPQAKVILTVRDADAWHRSVRRTIHALRQAAPTWLPYFGDIAKLTDEVVWHGTFAGRFTDRDHAVAVYERHVAEVRAGIPSERLLVFDVREGWPPLCAFLGVPVPEGVAFPHVNSARKLMLAVWLLRALPFLVAAGLLALAVYLVA